MSQAHDSEIERARIVLGLLETVGRDGSVSQRRLAAELGIALGLVNAYLKRCIRKGWVKVNEAPARRYAYYLTPHGFAEKSRLTVAYLSHSFSFFRAARADCAEALSAASGRGCRRIVLAGASELAEVATLCALDSGIEVVGVVDADASGARFVGLPVIESFSAVPDRCDGALLTDLKTPTETVAQAVARFGGERVFIPALLTGRVRREIGPVEVSEFAE